MILPFIFYPRKNVSERRNLELRENANPGK
jgi:hypothetical protein